MVDKNVYAVVLAGGSGTRFWPKSRHLSPKQLCRIGSESLTMLEQTLARIDPVIPPERRIIVTHTEQYAATKDIVGDRCGTIIGEPSAKNTANAILLGALEAQSQHTSSEDPVMISLHADAVIQNTEAFLTAIDTSVQVAREGYLSLLGIVPTYPETGYGYIEKGQALQDKRDSFLVKSFREKPHLELATTYCEKGNFFWNAGIFAWKIPKIIQEFNTFHPMIPEILQPLIAKYGSFTKVPANILAESYARLPNLTIDHGILEQSQDVALVKCSIGWQDVGSWDALEKCFPTDSDNNLIYGDSLSIDSKNCTIDTDGPFIGCIGMEDVVIVASKGAILVCPKNRSQEVKKIVSILKEQGRTELV